MKKTLLLILLSAVFGTGCATIQTCTDFGGIYVDDGNRPVATVAIENYGYYLFGIIPLICGNPELPNANDFKMFTDTVTVDGNMKILAGAAKDMKASVVGNIKTQYDETGAWSLCLIYKRVVFTSAILSNPKTTDGK